MDSKEFYWNRSDCQLIGTVLNEILNGFDLKDFLAVIGATKAEMQQIMTYLLKMPDGEVPSFSHYQITALRNALRETLRELGTDEFHTRTGFSFQEGQTLLRQLDSVFGT